MSVFTRVRNPTTASYAKNNLRLAQTWNSICKCTVVRYLPLLTCIKLSRMQYQCFVLGCDKEYLYMSSLKKHLVISHPIEYAAKVKTRQSKHPDALILVSTSKWLQGLGYYDLRAASADEGGEKWCWAWFRLPKKLIGAILWNFSFH
jgi:hypothetical protein